jgi:hypothetical protein
MKVWNDPFEACCNAEWAAKTANGNILASTLKYRMFRISPQPAQRIRRHFMLILLRLSSLVLASSISDRRGAKAFHCFDSNETISTSWSS